jgi:creatinine amidohydrolase
MVSERCETQGVRTAALPGVPYGVNTGQRDLNLCISIRPSVQYALLTEIAHSLAEHGVEKLVVVNGHGGNNFKPLLRELFQDVPDLFICFTNWWTVVDPLEFFDVPGDHAGELETAVMLHLYPDLVLPLEEAGSGNARGFSVAGLQKGTAWAPRHWKSITADTGVGDPTKAKAEKGHRFVDACVAEISDFVVELDATPMHKLYDG